MGEFSLVLRTETCLNHCQEPDEFILEHRGLIRYTRSRDDRIFHVGRVRAYRVHAALAARANETLFRVYDTYSQRLRELYARLYEGESDKLRATVRERFGVAESPDVLLLDWVVLHPRWRGLKMGQLIARRLIELLGTGCGLALADVRPLQVEACEALGVPPHWAPAATDEAQAKLERYAAHIGMQHLRGTNLFGMALEVE
jgi:hypothetical protein